MDFKNEPIVRVNVFVQNRDAFDKNSNSTPAKETIDLPKSFLFLNNSNVTESQFASLKNTSVELRGLGIVGLKILGNLQSNSDAKSAALDLSVAVNNAERSGISKEDVLSSIREEFYLATHKTFNNKSKIANPNAFVNKDSRDLADEGAREIIGSGIGAASVIPVFRAFSLGINLTGKTAGYLLSRFIAKEATEKSIELGAAGYFGGQYVYETATGSGLQAPLRFLAGQKVDAGEGPIAKAFNLVSDLVIGKDVAKGLGSFGKYVASKLSRKSGIDAIGDVGGESSKDEVTQFRDRLRSVIKTLKEEGIEFGGGIEVKEGNKGKSAYADKSEPGTIFVNPEGNVSKVGLEGPYHEMTHIMSRLAATLYGGLPPYFKAFSEKILQGIPEIKAALDNSKLYSNDPRSGVKEEEAGTYSFSAYLMNIVRSARKGGAKVELVTEVGKLANENIESFSDEAKTVMEALKTDLAELGFTKISEMSKVNDSGSPYHIETVKRNLQNAIDESAVKRFDPRIFQNRLRQIEEFQASGKLLESEIIKEPRLRTGSNATRHTQTNPRIVQQSLDEAFDAEFIPRGDFDQLKLNALIQSMSTNDQTKQNMLDFAILANQAKKLGYDSPEAKELSGVAVGLLEAARKSKDRPETQAEGEFRLKGVEGNFKAAGEYKGNIPTQSEKDSFFGPEYKAPEDKRSLGQYLADREDVSFPSKNGYDLDQNLINIFNESIKGFGREVDKSSGVFVNDQSGGRIVFKLKDIEVDLDSGSGESFRDDSPKKPSNRQDESDGSQGAMDDDGGGVGVMEPPAAPKAPQAKPVDESPARAPERAPQAKPGPSRPVPEFNPEPLPDKGGFGNFVIDAKPGKDLEFSPLPKANEADLKPKGQQDRLRQFQPENNLKDRRKENDNRDRNNRREEREENKRNDPAIAQFKPFDNLDLLGTSGYWYPAAPSFYAGEISIPAHILNSGRLEYNDN